MRVASGVSLKSGEKRRKEELVVEWPGWLSENQGALICISLEQVFCGF